MTGNIQILVAPGDYLWNMSAPIDASGWTSLKITASSPTRPNVTMEYAMILTFCESCSIENMNFLNATDTALASFSSVQFNVTNCDFVGCKALTFAGGIYSDNDALSLRNCRFIENSALSTDGGGAVMFSGSISIVDSSFERCQAPYGKGGSLFAFSVSGFTISRCNFTSNTALQGGAIYIIGNTAFASSIAQSNFNSNSATYLDVTLSYGGGAISINSPGQMTVNNSNFISNTGGSGGAVDVLDVVSLIFNTCTFSNNAAYSVGGVVKFNSDADLQFYDCQVENSNAAYGGVFGSNYAGTVTIRGSTFVGNRAGRGAVGAVFICAVSVTSSQFTNNTAAVAGGVFSVEDYRGLLGCIRSNFTANFAPQGGAISLESGSLICTGCRFVKNSATLGGALYVVDGTAVVGESTFDSNVAARGGAITAGFEFTCAHCFFFLDSSHVFFFMHPSRILS